MKGNCKKYLKKGSAFLVAPALFGSVLPGNNASAKFTFEDVKKFFGKVFSTKWVYWFLQKIKFWESKEEISPKVKKSWESEKGVSSKNKSLKGEKEVSSKIKPLESEEEISPKEKSTQKFNSKVEELKKVTKKNSPPGCFCIEGVGEFKYCFEVLGNNRIHMIKLEGENGLTYYIPPCEDKFVFVCESAGGGLKRFYDMEKLCCYTSEKSGDINGLCGENGYIKDLYPWDERGLELLSEDELCEMVQIKIFKNEVCKKDTGCALQYILDHRLECPGLDGPEALVGGDFSARIPLEKEIDKYAKFGTAIDLVYKKVNVASKEFYYRIDQFSSGVCFLSIGECLPENKIGYMVFPGKEDFIFRFDKRINGDFYEGLKVLDLRNKQIAELGNKYKSKDIINLASSNDLRNSVENWYFADIGGSKREDYERLRDICVCVKVIKEKDENVWTSCQLQGLAGNQGYNNIVMPPMNQINVNYYNGNFGMPNAPQQYNMQQKNFYNGYPNNQ